MGGRKSYRQRKVNGQFVWLSAGELEQDNREFFHVIPDIEEYRPTGGPEAEAFLKDPSKARMIRGRKQHREYLKRNGFMELGNEKETFLKYRGMSRDNYENWERKKRIAGEWIERSKRD